MSVTRHIPTHYTIRNPPGFKTLTKYSLRHVSPYSDYNHPEFRMQTELHAPGVWLKHFACKKKKKETLLETKSIFLADSSSTGIYHILM